MAKVKDKERKTYEHSNQKAVPMQYITQYIQIGNDNQINLNDARTILSHGTKKRIDQHDIIIGLLSKLYENDDSERTITKLSYAFEAEYGSLVEGKTSFLELAGKELRSFLIDHSDRFRVNDKNGTLYVSVNRNFQIKTNSPIIFDSASSTTLVDYDSEMSSPSSVQGSEAYVTAPSSRSVLQLTDDLLSSSSGSSEQESQFPMVPMSSSTHHDNSSSDQGTYQTVRRSKKKKKRKERKYKHSKIRNPNKHLTALFEKLCISGENEQIKFMSSEEYYVSNKKAFMLDLVSMWNVPNRDASYIILGIDPVTNNRNGLSEYVDIHLLDSLFTSEWCTGNPRYKYHEIESKGLLFGIIEIPVSEGEGSPCIIHFPSKEGTTGKGKLLVRSGSLNRTVSLTDPDFPSIYHWFAPFENHSGVAVNKKENTASFLNTRSQELDIQDSNGDDKNHCVDPKCALRLMNNFKSGSFILLAGDIKPGLSDADAIALIPLLACFDFDVYSRDRGLLSSNEGLIKKRRKLQIDTWKDPIGSITETSTLWSFLRGRRDIADSRIEGDTAQIWSRTTKDGVRQIIDQIQKFVIDYTTISILFLWPNEVGLSDIMFAFLQKLYDGIDPAPNIFLCIPEIPKHQKDLTTFNMIKQMYTDVTIVRMSFKTLFREIKKSQNSVQSNQCSSVYELPGSENKTVRFEEEQVVWLRENFEIMFLNNTYPKLTLEVVKHERDQFYRGGNLKWSLLYEYAEFVVERDLFKHIIEKLRASLDERRIQTYNLFHEPGSGGTCLGQRILWHFHGRYPCLKVKMNCFNSVNIEQIETIHDKVHLPILLLLDGEDDAKVHNLQRSLKARNIYAVILHVTRFNKKIPTKQSYEKQAWLKGEVSTNEAKKLAMKFADRCDGNQHKIKQLEKMSNEAGAGKCHYMYEFGLTTYLHEYRGISSFVNGYLELSSDKLLLNPGQKILGFLSLVYYYGHASLPMQFFSSMLNVPASHVVEIDDFPIFVQKCVVPDDQDGRKNNIRICHYLIAQEILEQILTHSDKGDRGTELGIKARKYLGRFCIEFIEYASRKHVRSSVTSQVVSFVLTRTFIFRNSNEIVDNSLQRRKPTFSKVMQDIVSEAPLFTERLELLKKLVDAFPSDPSFHAHLGRFYAYCRKNEDKMVEECFQKALNLCEKEANNRDLDRLDDRLKSTINHIYHMYGTVLKHRIAMYTGVSLDDKPPKTIKTDQVPKVLEWIMDTAKSAAHYFSKCREYTPEGQESSIGYIGEITVRIQACDFVKNNFKEGGFKGIGGFLSPRLSKSIPGRNFVKQSLSLIDTLFMECYKFVGNDEVDRSINTMLLWYNVLMRNEMTSFDAIASGNDIHAYRLQISVKKLRAGHVDSSLSKLEDISNRDDILHIASLYEKIFEEVARTGVPGNKRNLENDYLEWICAIRHGLYPKDYTLDEVLLNVRRWNDHIRSPLGKFYQFVLTSIIGFGGVNGKSSSEYLSEARLLQEEMQKLGKFVLRPKYPREWLGESTKGIRRLVQGTRFLGLHTDTKDVKSELSDLQICTGTICGPNNKKYAGNIYLDLDESNHMPVKVFYIPSVADLFSGQYANARVEFVMAFSIEHGYEAFDVKEIRRYGCSSINCSSRVEMTSDQEYAPCYSCGKILYRDSMNQVDAMHRKL